MDFLFYIRCCLKAGGTVLFALLWKNDIMLREKGLRERRQVIKNQVYLDELIQNLIKDSRLTHRQIVNLLEISNSAVHKVSLKEEEKREIRSKKNRPLCFSLRVS